MIFYHKTAPQPSYESKPLSKSISGLIGEAWSLFLHHLGRILGSKKQVSIHEDYMNDSQNFLTPQ